MSKSVFLVLCLALIWGSNFAISKVGIEQIGALPFRVFTILISTAVLVAFSYQQLKTYFKTASRNDIKRIGLLSLPNIFLVPMINNISLTYLSITTATILIYMMPCFVSLLTMASEKKGNLSSFFAVLLCSSGILVLSGFNGFNFGEYLMIFNAIIWALGAFMSQKIKLNHVPMPTLVCVQMIITLVMTLITFAVWACIDSSILEKLSVSSLLAVPTISTLIYIGVVGSAVAYYCWFSLIELKSAEYTSYAVLLSPVVSIVIAVTVFNEELKAITIMGGGLILASSFMILAKPFFDRRNF